MHWRTMKGLMMMSGEQAAVGFQVYGQVEDLGSCYLDIAVLETKIAQERSHSSSKLQVSTWYNLGAVIQKIAVNNNGGNLQELSLE